MQQHPVMLSALGLSPLAVKSSTLLSGFSIGLVFLLVLLLSSMMVSLFRRFTPRCYSLAFIFLITTTWTGIIDMAMQAWFFEMHLTLGIYISLVAVNALTLAFMNENALHDPFVMVYKKAAGTGTIVLVLVTVTGLLRELLSQGSLLTGPILFPQGMPIFSTSAGAFLILGCLIAIFNLIFTKVSSTA